MIGKIKFKSVLPSYKRTPLPFSLYSVLYFTSLQRQTSSWTNTKLLIQIYKKWSTGTIECEGWRQHFSLIFLILLFTKPNIEVSGWLFRPKHTSLTLFINLFQECCLHPSHSMVRQLLLNC